MPDALVIVGAGGHGRETAEIVRAINAAGMTWDLRGFVDDGTVVTDLLAAHSIGLIGRSTDVRHLGARYVVGIGSPRIRRRIVESLNGVRAVALVHPESVVLASGIGDGALVARRSVVGPRTALGLHAHVNVGVVVGAGCDVGDFVSVSPGTIVEDGAVLEADVFIGTRAIVTTGVRVGRGSIVGAGATVNHDLPAESRFVGRR